jgi:predicted dinucleotide-binding enzyme
VILIAIPGNAVRSLLDAYKDNLDGKVIMDATNRIGQEEINSLPEIMQALPHARIYRAFNHLGWENFENPQLDGIQIDLFYCGMPGESQQQVENLIADIGLRPVYVGGLEHAPTIDHLIRL